MASHDRQPAQRDHRAQDQGSSRQGLRSHHAAQTDDAVVGSRCRPFGQVPWLTDGDLSIFESGAILLHLGERCDALMPADPQGRSAVKEWLFVQPGNVPTGSRSP